MHFVLMPSLPVPYSKEDCTEKKCLPPIHMHMSANDSEKLNLLVQTDSHNALYAEYVLSKDNLAEHSVENNFSLFMEIQADSTTVCVFIWFRRQGSRFFQTTKT